jgi:hypothetical protein
MKKLIKMYTVGRGGAKKISVAISEHFSSMGEKVVRRHLSAIQHRKRIQAYLE